MTSPEPKIPSHLRAVQPGEKPGAKVPDLPLAGPPKPKKLPKAVSKVWDSLVPTLSAGGYLSPADGPALELAIRHYLIAVKAGDELLHDNTELVKYDDKNKREMKHPSSQIMRDHSSEFLKYANSIGLVFGAREKYNQSREPQGKEDMF